MFRVSPLVNAKQSHAIWVRFLVLGRKDTFQKMGQIINPVTGSHRFKHGAIGAGQLTSFTAWVSELPGLAMMAV